MGCVIVEDLKHFQVSWKSRYRTITRYKDTGSISKRHKDDRKITAISPEMIQKSKFRIDRNARQVLKVPDRHKFTFRQIKVRVETCAENSQLWIHREANISIDLDYIACNEKCTEAQGK